MAVVNSGEPVGTLRNALDAFVSIQETMIAEAAKLRDPQTPGGGSEPASTDKAVNRAVPAQY